MTREVIIHIGVEVVNSYTADIAFPFMRRKLLWEAVL